MPASAASIFSASRPSTAAIELVPAGAASAIALPRSTTALITLAASTASEAASAAYSPTEWPAAAGGSTPRRRRHPVTPLPLKHKAGCAFCGGWGWGGGGPFLVLPRLSLGRARPREFYGILAFGCLVRGPPVGGLILLQCPAPPPHRLQRAAEMRFELLQLLERVALGVADDLVRLRLRVLHDLRRVSLGAAQDLVLRSSLLRPLVGARHRACSLGVGLGHDPLLLGDGPVRLLDLVRKVEADLVDQLHHFVLVDHDLSRKRDMARVLDQVLDTVQQLVDLYLNFSFNALATGGGTRSETLPP